MPRHITRSFVQNILNEPDDSRTRSPVAVTLPSSEEKLLADGVDALVNSSDSANEILRNTQDWLKLLAAASEEHSKTDWEFEHRLQPLGSVLDESGCPTELKMNTEPLAMISLGLGPRPPRKLEDLVEPLRQNTAGQGDVNEKSLAEYDTYDELKTVLQTWNRTVLNERYGHGDLPEQREELLHALEERCREMEKVIAGDVQPAGQDERLLQALRAFRPEITGFANQTPYNIIAVMIANHLIAKPDLRVPDWSLWDALMESMWIESRLRLSERHSAERARLKAMFDSAVSTGSKEEVDNLMKRIEVFNEQMMIKGEEMVIEDLRAARRELWGKTLEEMQALTAAQAGQKSFLASLLPPARDILEKNCEDADARLEQVLQQHADTLEVEHAFAQGNTDAAKSLSERCVKRARKIAAVDVPKEDRARILRERMDNPMTAPMMLWIVEDNQSVWESSKKVLARLDGLQSSLEEIYEAAKHRLQTYDEVYDLVFSECVETGDIEGAGNSDSEPDQ